MIPNQVETCIRSFSPQYLVRWCPLSDYFEIVHLGYLSNQHSAHFGSIFGLEPSHMLYYPKKKVMDRMTHSINGQWTHK